MIRKTRAVMTDQNELLAKKCCMCQEVKDSINFYKDKHKTNSLSSRCKDCAKKAAMEWKRQNPEKVKQSRQKDYQRNKDQYSEYNKQWRENNADRVKQYYQQNKDVIKEQRKGKDNLLREMLRSANYRAIRNHLPFDLTIEYMETIALGSLSSYRRIAGLESSVFCKRKIQSHGAIIR